MPDKSTGRSRAAIHSCKMLRSRGRLVVLSINSTGAHLPDDHAEIHQRSMLSAVLHDSHFWIPVVVLFMGLAVLHWIS